MVKLNHPFAPRLEGVMHTLEAPLLEPRLSLETAAVSGLIGNGVTAEQTDFNAVTLTAAALTAARLPHASWLDTVVINAEAAGVYADSSTLTRVSFEQCRLTGVIFSGSTLTDICFTGCKLDLANFRSSVLKRVIFARCELTNADFSQANLTDVMFEHCNLVSIDVTGMTSKAVDMRSSDVTSPKGISGLKGASLTTAQLLILTPWLATELGIRIEDE